MRQPGLVGRVVGLDLRHHTLAVQMHVALVGAKRLAATRKREDGGVTVAAPVRVRAQVELASA